MRYCGVANEETLKVRVYMDWFSKYSYDVLKKVDFRISLKNALPGMEVCSLLWGEAKVSPKSDVIESFVQLILTIGKAKLQDFELPPAYLCALDSEKISFLPFHTVVDVFGMNDFNWNVAPSNKCTREFKYLKERVSGIIDGGKLTFDFDDDKSELKVFIDGMDNGLSSKIRIDKNNFVSVYLKWLKSVSPTIDVDWSNVKKSGLMEAYFYLADLLSENGKTLVENLYVVLDNDRYFFDRKVIDGIFATRQVGFNDRQHAYNDFWNRYERPPREEYREYIQQRRDLLVPQDVREMKGAFFTPKIWVEKSQEYLADVLGENWQDEYYVWDCAAGTGNLLVGLVNKYNIFASTLDECDVSIMRENSNLFKNHVFQFDFLNDGFEKLPLKLREIICDEEKRKKLVVYINPPYAEATSHKTAHGNDNHKPGVSTSHRTSELYKDKIGKASNELFAQFLARIYDEINGCKVGVFSTLKTLQGTSFEKFRSFFNARLESLFVVPANTFDNVSGEFPIGFQVWDTGKHEVFENVRADVFNKEGEFIGHKRFYASSNGGSINKWASRCDVLSSKHPIIGYQTNPAPDFQQNNLLCCSTCVGGGHFNYYAYCADNLIPGVVYFAVRHCMPKTWLNDRDQFLTPNDSWESDVEFQNDCLAFTLFHGQNRISSKDGVNHWIPFSEDEVGCRNSFDSNFMKDFIDGKVALNAPNDLFGTSTPVRGRLQFSGASKAVFEAGLELWCLYHSRAEENPNASFYDIREYFQGRSNGRMNPKSDDPEYNVCIKRLRELMRILAGKIEPKVFEHGFLRSCLSPIMFIV